MSCRKSCLLIKPIRITYTVTAGSWHLVGVQMFRILGYECDGLWSYNPNMSSILQILWITPVVMRKELKSARNHVQTFLLSLIYRPSRRQVIQYWSCSDVTVAVYPLRSDWGLCICPAFSLTPTLFALPAEDECAQGWTGIKRDAYSMSQSIWKKNCKMSGKV